MLLEELGSEIRGNKYWATDERRACKLCEEEKEDLELVMKRCRHTGTREEDWEKWKRKRVKDKGN